MALASAKLDAANRELEKATQRLDKCKAKLDALQAQFESKMAEKQAIEDNANKPLVIEPVVTTLVKSIDVDKAIEENIAKASQEGNKLMQSIDEEGNLINADRMDVPGKNLLFGDSANDDVSTADLRKELFESEDVIVGKQADNDHGLSEILERQKLREAKADTTNNDE